MVIYHGISFDIEISKRKSEADIEPIHQSVVP